MSEATPVGAPVGAPVVASRWRDAGAGLCVAGLLIPEAVAYSGLAQLPVSHALNATLVGLVIYALLGRSRFAIVAPTSSSASLTAAAVVSMPGLAGPVSVQGFVQASMALVLLAGVILMLLAWAGQGQLSAFVSRPVLRGFAFALAITIVIKQLPDALGFGLPQPLHADPLRILLYTVTHASVWHGPSVAVALIPIQVAVHPQDAIGSAAWTRADGLPFRAWRLAFGRQGPAFAHRGRRNLRVQVNGRGGLAPGSILNRSCRRKLNLDKPNQCHHPNCGVNAGRSPRDQ